MRKRHSDSPLPDRFDDAGILAQGEIALRRHSRIRAKVVIFDKPKNLKAFWENTIKKGGLGRGCVGAVTPLAYERVLFKKGHPEVSTLIVDPVYFCLIGLCQSHLTMEIICHESVHAGFAYAKRMRHDMWTNALDLDEENVCYPAGIIADAINRFLHKRKLFL